MSALTHLSAARMLEKELLALKCGDCGHRASSHSLHSDVCAGNGSWSGEKPCRCVRWADPKSDLLDMLDGKAAKR